MRQIGLLDKTELIYCDSCCSGYADRIHELIVISRELSASQDRASLQRTISRNYITEANYIEFSGVKVASTYELSDSVASFIFLLSCI